MTTVEETTESIIVVVLLCSVVLLSEGHVRELEQGERVPKRGQRRERPGEVQHDHVPLLVALAHLPIARHASNAFGSGV